MLGTTSQKSQKFPNFENLMSDKFLDTITNISSQLQAGFFDDNISKGNEQNSLTLCMQIDIERKEKFDTFFFHRCVHRCVHRCAQANQNLCKIYVMAPRLSGGFEGFGNDPV